MIETMPRTVNTGLGAMFILGALTFMSGDSLEDFALALLLGLIIGTYSTVFVATPLASYLQQVQPFSREKKERKERDPSDSGAVVRSEEHTSELQSLMRISYAVFCLKK